MATSSIVWLLLGGFVVLIVGAESLVRGAARLAIALGITPLVVGLTVVAYGTSAPELAVTVQALLAQSPQPELAIGNVVGSNIANILIVLGLSATAAPLVISRVTVRTTVPVMIGVTGLAWYLCLDGTLSRVEGICLVTGSIVFTAVSVLRGRRSMVAIPPVGGEVGAAGGARQSAMPFVVNLLLVAVGLGLLVLGARWLIDGATEVARRLQVSELMIGLTIVAVGTSLPEIATSLIATVRGHRDIAVGNVVGSNIFNLLLVLGIAVSFSPESVSVPADALRYDIPIMFAVTVACWPVFYTASIINRWEGLAFLASYVAYAVFLYLKETHHHAFSQYTAVMLYVALPLTALLLVALAIRQWRRNAEVIVSAE